MTRTREDTPAERRCWGLRFASRRRAAASTRTSTSAGEGRDWPGFASASPAAARSMRRAPSSRISSTSTRASIFTVASWRHVA